MKYEIHFIGGEKIAASEKLVNKVQEGMKAKARVLTQHVAKTKTVKRMIVLSNITHISELK